MSEVGLQENEELASSRDLALQLSGGLMIRNAREAEGLDIAALAVTLKVPVKKLEALEADRFDLLTDTVFVRALASSVCRTLKVDPVLILAQLPQPTLASLKTDESGINTPFRVSVSGAGFPYLGQLSKPFVLAVVVLLIGVLVLIFFPFPLKTNVSGIKKLGVDLETPKSVLSISADKSKYTETASSILPISSSPLNPGTSIASENGIASSPQMLVAGSGATSGVVTFTANGSSWVEVIDANGVVQVRKTMTGGEIVGVSGTTPLSVVIGRADSTTVQVHGQPFDLSALTKDNVARFEVK